MRIKVEDSKKKKLPISTTDWISNTKFISLSNRLGLSFCLLLLSLPLCFSLFFYSLICITSLRVSLFYLLTWFYLSVSVSPLFGKVRGWVCPKPFPVQDEKERFLPVQSVMPIKTRNILLQRKVKKSKSIQRVSIYWALRCSTSDSYVVR